MRTEAWWVCRVCDLAVQKVGGGGGALHNKEGHCKVCPGAGYSIEQIPQQDLPTRRWKP